MKIYIKENQIESLKEGVLDNINTADSMELGGEKLYCTDTPSSCYAYPFIINVYGEYLSSRDSDYCYNIIHDDLIELEAYYRLTGDFWISEDVNEDDVKEKFNEINGDIIMRGRVFFNDKTHDVGFAVWDIDDFSNDEILDAIDKTFKWFNCHYNENNIWIGYYMKTVSLKQFLKRGTPEEEREKREIASRYNNEKPKASKGNKWGDKLGKMTLAQWHSMIYQEEKQVHPEEADEFTIGGDGVDASEYKHIEINESIEKPRIGISINCRKVDFEDLILNQGKTIETRDAKSPLLKYVNQRVGLVRTGTKMPYVFAYATIGEPIRYKNEEEWKRDGRHKIKINNKKFSKYQWKEGKLGFPLIDIEKCERVYLKTFKPTKDRFTARYIDENMSINESLGYDISEIGSVQPYSFDFDEDWYKEYLSDNELIDNEETKLNYIKENCTFDIVLYDSEYSHQMDCITMMYDEIVDEFGERLANDVVEACIQGKEPYLELLCYTDDDAVDITDISSMEADALKKLKHGIYYKGARGFLLTNGEIVYTDAEHNMITRVAGIDDKFEAIKKGWIRLLANSIDVGKQPTSQQKDILRQVISSYSNEELYLDIFGDREYGCVYYNPTWRKVLADIDRFYIEGIRPIGDDGRMSENAEIELSPSEVDTSSFELENTLEPHIWKNGVIDSMVRLKLLDIADDFIEKINVKWVKPKDIILTGSICNFNWSEYSDIDLHILYDFKEIDKRTDFVQEYFNDKKNEWNKEHNSLTIRGFNVEIYVQNIHDINYSSGIYSLEKNEWLKKPSKDEFTNLTDSEKSKIKLIAASFITYIDELLDSFKITSDNHKLEELNNEVSDLTEKLKELRSKSLEKDGEMGVGNLVYKYCRREGYLDKLWKLKDKIYDKMNSL